MSYGNQPDHRLLDRLKVRDLLLQVAASVVKASPVGLPRAEHVAQLRALCDSDLERQWLDFVDQRNLRLPDAAQVLIEACHTRVDFLYREQRVAVYVDGPQHDFPDVEAKDRHADACLEDQGITSVRFTYRKETWDALCDRHGYCFMTSATKSETG
jgi:very-short-patch-repair endonuclease